MTSTASQPAFWLRRRSRTRRRRRRRRRSRRAEHASQFVQRATPKKFSLFGPPERRRGKRGRRRNFLQVAPGSRVLTPRLMILTARHRLIRQALAASKFSRPSPQLWRRKLERLHWWCHVRQAPRRAGFAGLHAFQVIVPRERISERSQGIEVPKISCLGSAEVVKSITQQQVSEWVGHRTE